MSKKTVLVIEDEENIQELIRYNLEENGFHVCISGFGDKGFEDARKIKPDLILLDIMLPGIDGLEVCKKLRLDDVTSHIPVIMLTAKSTETDKVLGLEFGADDYVTKPFSPRELLARVKAVLRRSDHKTKSKILKVGLVEMDIDRHIVKLDNHIIELTSKEFNLLKVLIEVNGRVLTREYLLDHVWGYQHSGNIETRTIDMHIGQLRKKLKKEAYRIITVKNEGYRLDNE